MTRNVAAHPAYDDATVVVHNALKGPGADAQNVSDDAKIGVGASNVNLYDQDLRKKGKIECTDLAFFFIF